MLMITTIMRKGVRTLRLRELEAMAPLSLSLIILISIVSNAQKL
jgi:hypothetical protein